MHALHIISVCVYTDSWGQYGKAVVKHCALGFNARMPWFVSIMALVKTKAQLPWFAQYISSDMLAVSQVVPLEILPLKDC